MSKTGINKVILIGNVGQEPEMRQLPNGTPVAQFSVATTESWKDKNTQEWRDQTEWHRIVVYRKLAEYAVNYVKVGSRIYAEGRIQSRKWKDGQGQDRQSFEIIVNELKILESGKRGSSESQVEKDRSFDQPLTSKPNNKSLLSNDNQAPFDPLELEDEDIPF